MSDWTAALEAAICSARMSMEGEIRAGSRTGTQVVACEELLAPWTPGKYEIGDARTHAGQAWRCCQAHNNANNPDIEPGHSPDQWAPYHTTDPARAKPFVQPTGAHDAYQQGEVCIWEGRLYRSVMEGANSHSPADYPQGWEEVAL